MSPGDQERIGIIGLGAVGGSLALAMRDRAPVVAWSRDPVDRASARAEGIHVCREDYSAWIGEMADATAIVIAVPVDEVAAVARDIVPRVSGDALVMHTGSLQRAEALGLTDAEFRRVLGVHPIAGSERSGFGAASAGMFRGAAVRAEARATAAQRLRIEMLWRQAGIDRLTWDEATAHDQLMSWVSHLPQLTSTALAAALAAQGIAHGDVGPGARDATRLASSDFATWAPILRNAPRETALALNHLTRMLEAISESLADDDSKSFAAIWEQARAWRTRTEKAM
jgi:prephenate dehydrogenase